MSTKKNAVSDGNSGGKYDDEARYEVWLAKPFRRGHRILSPMNRHVLTGKVLNEIPSEAIGNVQPL